MPVIELKHVLSFSSEDSKWPAQNLLKGDGFKKWKSASVGEKQVSVVLQFEKASQIQSLDIGNEGSAFIEVLVARSTEKAEPDFQVLLVASSFMNPQESKSSSNLNRVRMFDKEKLAKSLLGQKWDLVKVVCTQPFNKNVQYGLSFVKFHAPSESESDRAPTKPNPLGMFKMREKGKEDGVKVGSAFSAYKREAPDSSGASASASARSVSKFADEVLAKEAATMRAKVGERSEEVRTPKRKMETNGSESARKRGRDAPSPTPGNRREERRKTPEPRRRTATPTSTDRRRRSPSPSRRGRRSPIVRPFSKLMSKVVFAMSGYQNPERGDLRDKACEMGATYKSDWGRGCTHLICAFVNTPKYNVVRGKGRIVDAEWITRCYKEKKLLSWRRFRVGKARTPSGSSDEECIAEEIAAKKTVKTDDTKYTTKKTSSNVDERSERRAEKKEETTSSVSPVRANKPSTSTTDEKPSTSTMGVKKNAIAYADWSSDEDSVYDRDTDVEEMNTDDEIERIQTAENAERKISPKKGDRLKLTDFLDGYNFFVYGDMTPGDRRTLKRIIVAYKGRLVEYMDDRVTHVLTRAKWDSNFDKALGENERLKFVRPEWVYECDRAQKTVGYETFCVESD